jgi:predicted phosphoadenosine phosphosulfate sulfurtransferase
LFLFKLITEYKVVIATIAINDFYGFLVNYEEFHKYYNQWVMIKWKIYKILVFLRKNESRNFRIIVTIISVSL